MKSKLLLLVSLMLLLVTINYAQTSAAASGIAVQGIARDNNNTALANETITFRFTLYYNDPAPVNIFVENTGITTDAFGVFSYVLDVDPSTNANFSNNNIFLKIEDVSSGVVISDEVFKHVPYAISANNGVPTGSIMPYIGLEAPTGWVLCDGRDLTLIDGSANLIALVGSNAPNLQGMFLRGAGVSPVNGQAGPSLNTTQNDAYQDHGHFNNFSINNGGSHSHNTYLSQQPAQYTGTAGSNGNIRAVSYDGVAPQVNGGIIANPAGNHSHGISGGVSWANYGNRSSETRPVNYGVNYIIKL